MKYLSSAGALVAKPVRALPVLQKDLVGVGGDSVLHDIQAMCLFWIQTERETRDKMCDIVRSQKRRKTVRNPDPSWNHGGTLALQRSIDIGKRA